MKVVEQNPLQSLLSLFLRTSLLKFIQATYEEISVEQVSQSYPAVFVGKVIAAYKECLVINCPYVPHRSRTPALGNLVFVSERAIRGLNEVDGKATIEDMFLRSKESLAIKEAFVDKLKEQRNQENGNE